MNAMEYKARTNNNIPNRY